MRQDPNITWIVVRIDMMWYYLTKTWYQIIFTGKKDLVLTEKAGIMFFLRLVIESDKLIFDVIVFFFFLDGRIENV